jgi:hypothetical protein
MAGFAVTTEGNKPYPSTALARVCPKKLQGSLPTIEELEKELGAASEDEPQG